MCFFIGFLATKNKSTSQVPAQPEKHSNSNTPKPTTASSTEPNADHYEKFLAEQKRREDMGGVNKAAKRQRINSAPTDSSIRTSTSHSIPPYLCKVTIRIYWVIIKLINLIHVEQSRVKS